jgi:acyl-CoA thioesterase-1
MRATKSNLNSAGSRSRRALLALLLLFANIATASAAQVTVVALGTSNSKGRGLAASESYPAQLQALLRAKGYDVRIINMGVNGDSTAGILARVKSVPQGTRLVLVEYAKGNEDRHHVTNTSANMAEIRSELAARKIKSVDITGVMSLAFVRARGSGGLINAGGPHLNAAAYGEVARQVLPEVEAAIGR